MRTQLDPSSVGLVGKMLVENNLQKGTRAKPGFSTDEKHQALYTIHGVIYIVFLPK